MSPRMVYLECVSDCNTVLQIRPLNVVLEIGLLLEQTQVFGSKAK